MESPRPTEQNEQANPYAPPQPTFVELRLRIQGGVPQFSVEDIAAWSWTIYKTRFTHCLAAFWGIFTLNWLCQRLIVFLAEAIASLRDPALERLAQFAALFLTFVVLVWLTIGQYMLFLRIARGQVIALEDIFTGSRFLLTTILAGLAFFGLMAVPLFGLDLLLRGLGEMIVTEPSLAGVLGILAGCLACVAVIFFLFVRLGFFLYVVIDQNAGVFSALAITWRLCSRHVVTIILVYLLALTINLGGLLLFCVGWVFTVPFCSLMMAVTYQAMTGWGAVFGGSTLDNEES
jgi:hypothetical protein